VGDLKIYTKSQPDLKSKSKSKRPNPSDSNGDGVVKLFESSADVLLPASNDILEKCIEFSDMVEAYFKALGRVIAFCLFNRMHLSNHILPQLYRNYLFRGLSPMDDGYEFADLMYHFMEMIGIFKPGEDIDKIVDFVLASDSADESEATMKPEERQERARHIIENQYITGRSTALNALKHGISLSGK